MVDALSIPAAGGGAGSTGAIGRAEEWLAFQELIAVINLRRIGWLVLTATVLVAGAAAMNVIDPELRVARLNAILAIDLVLSGGVLLLVGMARRSVPVPRWSRNLGAWFCGLVLAMMDHYYFSLMTEFGLTTSYVLGVATVGIICLVPPRIFIPILLANHVLYCLLVVAAELPPHVSIAALVDGSGAVLISGLASCFLFEAKWKDFRKERLIARRNLELASANAELQERHAEMNELMAIAAHDLSSPILGMKNLMDLARSQTEITRERLWRVLDSASDGCAGVLAQIERLVGAHAAEHRNQSAELQRQDIVPRLRGAAERARAIADLKAIRIELELGAPGVEACVDAGMLDQALQNLLSNAVKYAPRGSVVTVALLAGEGHVLVEVRDRGPGIPAGDQVHLFQKFRKGTSRPTAGEPGSGLGLFIVRKQIEAMGGRVCYLPHEPHGAVFRLELPQA